MNARLLPIALALLSMVVPTTPAQPTAATADIILTPEAPRWQAGTRAQIVGFRLGSDRLFDGILVLNGGKKPLTEVQVGCFLEATLPGDTEPTTIGFLASETFSVNVQPNEVVALTEVDWRIDGIIGILMGLWDRQSNLAVTARLGIVEAEWKNGKRFVLEISAGFRERPNRALDGISNTLMVEELMATLEGISAPSEPGPAPQTECQAADNWACVVSRLTGECIGSVRCLEPRLCNSKCVRILTVPRS